MRYGQCFWCARQGEVETHHIFRCVGGASRTKSDRLGLTVDLCHECHQTGRDAVHRCADTDRELKRFGQKKAMLEQNWTKEDCKSFRPALACLIDMLGKRYPQAKLCFILNSELSEEVNESMREVCKHYGVQLVELHDIEKQNGHPSICGMKSICEQLLEAGL